MSEMRLGVLGQARFQPVHLHDQHGPGVEREAEMKSRLHRLEDGRIEHLQGCRDDPRADEVADGVGGIVHVLEDAQQGSIRFGVAGQPHPILGNHAKGAFRADDHPGQVVAGIVLDRPAGADDAGVGQDDLDGQHMVDRDAVLEGVWPAAVGGDVAAYRAGALAGRVRGEVVAVRLQVVCQPQVDHARFDDGVAVAVIDLDDALHAGQGNDHAAADRQTAARQAGAGAARQERHAVGVAGLDDLNDLVGADGKKTTTSGVFFSIV